MAIYRVPGIHADQYRSSWIYRSDLKNYGRVREKWLALSRFLPPSVPGFQSRNDFRRLSSIFWGCVYGLNHPKIPGSYVEDGIVFMVIWWSISRGLCHDHDQPLPVLGPQYRNDSRRHSLPTTDERSYCGYLSYLQNRFQDMAEYEAHYESGFNNFIYKWKNNIFLIS